MNKQSILSLVFLSLSHIPFQVSAEMLYAYRGVRASSCVTQPPTGSTTEVGHVPNAKPWAGDGKTGNSKICMGKPMAMAAGRAQLHVIVNDVVNLVVLPLEDIFCDSTEDISCDSTAVDVFTPDFFILEISITGNGSGTVTTPKGNSYSNDECPSGPCIEWSPMTLLESDIILLESGVKKGSRSEATRDSAESGSAVEIDLETDPDLDSKFKGSTCEKSPQQTEIIDGQTQQNTIVVRCTVTFELIKASVTLTSKFLELEKDGHFSDTAVAFLGSVASPAGLEKDDANKILLHSATDVKITGTITVEPLYIGQLVNMLAVVGFAPAGSDGVQLSFYMREGKHFKPWDGNIMALSAFQKDVRVEQEQTLEIYQGSLLDGRYEVYFGYRLGEGTIIFNSEPLMIQLTSNP